MTANDISAMLFCSPQTCSIAKSSGTLHLAQVRALSLQKHCRSLQAPLTLISQDLGLLDKQPCNDQVSQDICFQ